MRGLRKTHMSQSDSMTSSKCMDTKKMRMNPSAKCELSRLRIPGRAKRLLRTMMKRAQSSRAITMGSTMAATQTRTRGVPSVRLVRFYPTADAPYASSTLAATHAAMLLPMSCRRFYSTSRAARRSHQQTSPVIARARRPESSAPCSTSSDARAPSATSTYAATALIRRASARSLADGAGVEDAREGGREEAERLA